MSRLPPRDGERIDRERELSFSFDGKEVEGPRGRHDRLGAVRRRAAHVLAQLQVPPPPRPHVLRRPVPQLPRAGGRRSRRARLHRAAARGHAGRAHERLPVARVRRDARHRPVRRALHAARLLLQDVHPPAAPVAALREGAAPRRRPRQDRARTSRSASGAPSTGAATPTCWWSGAARPGLARRDRRGRARAPTWCSRRGRGARRAPARRGRATRARASWPTGARGRAWRCSRRRPRWAPSTASCPSGRATRSTRCARGGIVYATGSIEQPLLFPGNDLPGVMLSGGAVRLAALYGLSPGSRAVVATVDDRGLEAAVALLDAGVELAAVADLREHGSSDAARAADAPRRAACCAARRCSRPRAARRSSGSRSARPAPARAARASTRSPATCSWCPAAARRPRRCSPQSGARTGYDERRGCFALAELPEGVHAAGEVAGSGRARRGRALRRRGGRRGRPRARLRRRVLARARGGRARRPWSTARRARRRRAAGGHERAARQVLRLPVRGRDREGHPPERGGGLRLDRALQALHDHDDGALPGPHVPAARGAADGRGDRAEPGRGGHHHRPAAVARGADGRAGRAAVRARQALVDARAPPRARRQRAVGGRLAARLRLRRPRAPRRWPCTRPPG